MAIPAPRNLALDPGDSSEGGAYRPAAYGD
jgi:hypothetical protein